MGYTRLGKVLSQSSYNGILEALELQNANLQGKGVISGLALSNGGALEVDISSGIMLGLKAASIASGTIETVDASTRYVWVDEDGTFTLSASSADPGGSIICLGEVTSAGGVITAINTDGRMVAGWANPYVTILQDQIDALDTRVTALEGP